ncbi:hypothetical protein [Streptomyces sp. NPDC093260]|uniref:hypothetical protein n=1 Tax=Streptomyces sp. NPDC093260 TaxID=3155073 RepID=UPI003448EF10
MPLHSRPESERYAEDESEYTVVLERYDTVVIDESSGDHIHVITPVRAAEAEVPLFRPDACRR